MTPPIPQKTAKTAVFRQRWQALKVVRSIAAVRQRPRTPRNWRCSFAFSSLSFDISIENSMQRWSSDFQGLFCVKIRKMAQGSNDLSTLPLKTPTNMEWNEYVKRKRAEGTAKSHGKTRTPPFITPAWVQNFTRSVGTRMAITGRHTCTSKGRAWPLRASEPLRFWNRSVKNR